ncbi:protein kinase [Mycobacterium sp. MYCO198283]|uniref:protein kinase domain-containing protein n=1 Tax=Mycobacterium sp. MYCO198283 TaxID=2883505 RepID=UPI001E5E60CF|nr:protein kinase [Mycobacterium sp. MYCO198283]MCG5432715.1 protein kinase [Mycobacterium sp. MYCO198283]
MDAPLHRTAAALDPLVGAALDGRYRVDTVIATGGMSAVYRGLDLRLDRPVAIKVMDRRYAGDRQFLTRFQREARAVARLKDPGLVAVYDQGLGTPGGWPPYLVMELVEGGTLRELLDERGPMPPHAVAAVLRPVLGGLAVAHRGGLVHRDVKPENVLISDDGEVKIADFGLVRAVAEAQITSASVILGTAAYLSPEQVSTGEADPRSDVYATGIMVFELFTGTVPFTGDTPLSVAYRRLEADVPPPSTRITGVPTAFDGFVLRATAREPGRRYADADAMADDLDAIVDDLGLPPFRVPAPRNSALHRSAVAPRPDATTAMPVPIGPQPAPPRGPRATRQFTRGPADWEPEDGEPEDSDDEWPGGTATFAGIGIEEFAWDRQRSRRSALLWLAVVLVLTGAVGAGGWLVGSNLDGLLTLR